jgi:hypothetical protein
MSKRINNMDDVKDALTSDQALDGMSHSALLRWCADKDELLLRARLERVARVKDYPPAWIEHKVGKILGEVLQEVRRWRDEQGC